jgi:hypothetical protein
LLSGSRVLIGVLADAQPLQLLETGGVSQRPEIRPESISTEIWEYLYI